MKERSVANRVTAQTTNCADLTQRTTKADYPPRAKRTQWNGYLARNRLVLQLTLHTCAFPIILAFWFHQIWSFLVFSPEKRMENIYPPWFFTKNGWAIHFGFAFLPKTYASYTAALDFHQKRMGYSFPLCFFAKHVCKIRFCFGFLPKNICFMHFRFGFFPETYASSISAVVFYQQRMRYSIPR